MDRIKNLCIDIANAIRSKSKSIQLIAPKDFSSAIESIETRSGFTGHADAEGLRKIGWTESDIQYFQENGVHWDEEYDDDYKVPEENIALYGVIDANTNFQDYADQIVYLPKIDLKDVTDASYMFSDLKRLIAIPYLDTSKVESMAGMFKNCYKLTTINSLSTDSCTDMTDMFYDCLSLRKIPYINTRNVRYMTKTFYMCMSLTYIGELDTANVVNFDESFYYCCNLRQILALDFSSVKSAISTFKTCPNLETVFIKGPFSSYASASLLISGSNNWPFRGCSTLRNLRLSEGLHSNAKGILHLDSSGYITMSTIIDLIRQNKGISIQICLNTRVYNKAIDNDDVKDALEYAGTVQLIQSE